MVSALWKACASGDAALVADLLKEATSVDIEVKDHTGVTPLIQAIRHGHVQVVSILLEHGADPANGSSSGRPENYTSEPAILELLSAAVAKHAQAQAQAQTAPTQQPAAPYPAPYGPEGYAYDPAHDPNAQKAYYGPPVPMPYAPYPYPVQSPDGAPPPNGAPPVAYYPMPPPPPQGPQPEQSADGAQPGNHLPPLHVTRGIPCRYFPACRYGSACMFLHPQTPYFPGPLPPPAQYPPPPQQFEQQMSPQAYPQAYYPVPPGAYPPPPPGMVGSPHSHPTSPRPMVPGHSRAPSEMISPLAVPPALPPVPVYVPAPMSPYGVQHGLPPMGMVPGPGMMSSPPAMASPQMFPSTAPMGPAQLPPLSPYHPRRDSISSYHPEFTSPVMNAGDGMVPKSPLTLGMTMDGYPGGPHHARDGSVHHRRGGRPSISGGRGKPPCLFFPSGRCRNGDQCRFPHVMPADGASPGTPSSRLNKSRGSMGSIESKLANLGLRDDAGAPNGQKVNGFGDGHFNGNGNGHFNGNGRGAFNGARGTGIKRSPPKPPQRVPVAEDFPVLSGTKTPPQQPNGHANGTLTPNGPTAAQVLRAPPPAQKSAATPDLPKAPADGEAAGKPLEAVTQEVPVSA